MKRSSVVNAECVRRGLSKEVRERKKEKVKRKRDSKSLSFDPKG